MLNMHSIGGPREVCKGDSGGPLMWKNPANGRYIILGNKNVADLIYLFNFGYFLIT